MLSEEACKTESRGSGTHDKKLGLHVRTHVDVFLNGFMALEDKLVDLVTGTVLLKMTS